MKELMSDLAESNAAIVLGGFSSHLANRNECNEFRKQDIKVVRWVVLPGEADQHRSIVSALAGKKPEDGSTCRLKALAA